MSNLYSVCEFTVYNRHSLKGVGLGSKLLTDKDLSFHPCLEEHRRQTRVGVCRPASACCPRPWRRPASSLLRYYPSHFFSPPPALAAQNRSQYPRQTLVVVGSGQCWSTSKRIVSALLAHKTELFFHFTCPSIQPYSLVTWQRNTCFVCNWTVNIPCI